MAVPQLALWPLELSPLGPLGAGGVPPERGSGWGIWAAVLIKLLVGASQRRGIPRRVRPALKSCAGVDSEAKDCTCWTPGWRVPCRRGRRARTRRDDVCRGGPVVWVRPVVSFPGDLFLSLQPGGRCRLLGLRVDQG